MEECKTKYPVILVHGLGYSDKTLDRYSILNTGYWGDIPLILRRKGAEVFFGCQDANGEIRQNAQQLMDTVNIVCKQQDVEKVNLIAHSKGGVEARYMITHLDNGEHVASLTTIATPHRGIVTSDKIARRSKLLQKLFYQQIRTLISAGGGEMIEDFSVYEQLTADYMEVFNELVPDVEGVYYQSYACDMKRMSKDVPLSLFYRIVKSSEGPNDGIVSVESAKWGEFKGVYMGESGKGISHSIATGGRPISAKIHRAGNIADFYVRIVTDLKERGL